MELDNQRRFRIVTQLWEILVPTQSNEGKPFRTRYHRVWDKKVRKIAGGLTILTPAKGQWLYKDKLFEERMIPVRIACTEEQINQIIDITMQYYKQLAVMAYRISEKVIIKKIDQTRSIPLDISTSNW
jgi:hypothetical protein